MKWEIILFSSLLEQYVENVSAIAQLVSDADKSANDIIREEAFYGSDPSTFPGVQVLKETVGPFEKLFKFLLQWANTESRSEFSSKHRIE